MKSREPAFRSRLGSAAVAVAGAALAVLMLIAGSQALLQAGSAGRTAEILVEGPLARVQAEEITAALAPWLDQSPETLDLGSLRDEVQKLPWISRARVERRWPDRLRVRIWERSAVARWGDHALLDSEARVFMPPAAQLDLPLPRLMAPAGRERDVLEAYLRLQERLDASALAPVALSMDLRGEWTALANTGIEMRLGRESPELRVPVLRGPVARALESSLAQVRYVDLRYTNGFSVGWKPEASVPATSGEKVHG